jgi:hypothetical protein
VWTLQVFIKLCFLQTTGKNDSGFSIFGVLKNLQKYQRARFSQDAKNRSVQRLDTLVFSISSILIKAVNSWQFAASKISIYSEISA